MTSLHPARQRAERFDSLLGIRGDDARLDRGTAELLELVDALHALPEASARPEFVSSLRERLMTAADTELVPVTSAATESSDAARIDQRLTVTPRRRTRHDRRLAAALGAFAIVGATTSMAVASQGSMPGDALYPLKRAIENTHETFTAGNHGKGTVLLHNANTRLDELGSMTKGGNADSGQVTTELNSFSSDASQASDLLISDFKATGNRSSINELRNFNASSVSALSSLEANIPQASRPALVAAARTLFQGDAAAGAACPSCSSPGITEVPPNILASATGVFDTTQQQLSAGGALPSTAPSPSTGFGGQTIPDPTSLPSLPTTTPTSVPTAVSSALPSSKPTASAPTSPTGRATSTASQGVGIVTGQKTPTIVPTEVATVIGSVLDGVNQVLGGVTGGLGGGQ